MASIGAVLLLYLQHWLAMCVRDGVTQRGVITPVLSPARTLQHYNTTTIRSN